MDTTKASGHARLLLKAAEILGGEDKLRAFLGPAPGFERWMDGTSLLPTTLFLKLADLVSEHNKDFASQLASSRAELRETHESLKERTRQRTEGARARRAKAQDARNWSIVLRSRRLQETVVDGPLRLNHRLFDASFVPKDRTELLDTALDATLTVAGTDLGNVQIIGADGALRIDVYRGFEKPFLDFFSVVSRPECACGLAISLGRQVFIPNVRRNSMFMGTDAGKALESSGCVGVTSTPLVHHTGLVLGMISTHYRESREEHQAALASLELIAKRAASWLDAVGSR